MEESARFLYENATSMVDLPVRTLTAHSSLAPSLPGGATFFATAATFTVVPKKRWFKFDSFLSPKCVGAVWLVLPVRPFCGLCRRP